MYVTQLTSTKYYNQNIPVIEHNPSNEIKAVQP